MEQLKNSFVAFKTICLICTKREQMKIMEMKCLPIDLIEQPARVDEKTKRRRRLSLERTLEMQIE